MSFWQRIRRLVHRKPVQPPTAKKVYESMHGKSVLDVNEALQWAYRTGSENERQHRAPLYGTACPEHNLPLQETDPGHFVCLLTHEPHNQQPQQTQPLPIAHTGDFARTITQLYRERGMLPGEDTIRMAALALRQKEPPRQG